MATRHMAPARSDHGLTLDDRTFAEVGERFRALGEPARLRILDALRPKELTVGELVDRTGLSQANVSKHLQLLHTLGFVVRSKHGLFVHYQLADDDVVRLCDVMCGRIANPGRAALASPAGRHRSRRARARRPSAMSNGR